MGSLTTLMIAFVFSVAALEFVKIAIALGAMLRGGNFGFCKLRESYKDIWGDSNL